MALLDHLLIMKIEKNGGKDEGEESSLVEAIKENKQAEVKTAEDSHQEDEDMKIDGSKPKQGRKGLLGKRAQNPALIQPNTVAPDNARAATQAKLIAEAWKEINDGRFPNIELLKRRGLKGHLFSEAFVCFQKEKESAMLKNPNPVTKKEVTFAECIKSVNSRH